MLCVLRELNKEKYERKKGILLRLNPRRQTSIFDYTKSDIVVIFKDMCASSEYLHAMFIHTYQYSPFEGVYPVNSGNFLLYSGEGRK